ncbi:hypothetical protein A3J61_00655 [Candidatus Nomurabacteria bacterium RIFCSPHIGHO2_02_FULL_38_15]|uniref:Reverse transcriptase domain-containing protein n=1 Tax=Candidatus Nomurabacteria bacterium RIFCSPHIGHO2_02_FULL_38_15 TaxID=1801752 RepID=A0A1F6VSU4_9BACT|nr:MAG: hypothetical protein A3J61_00655 [Candidatus Nomurabacteria bacterium RIFCSPHIGHO2_02_FULL_38_15]
MLPYRSFSVHDPKERIIHSAEVCDRVVHQALVSTIEPLFEKFFIDDSFSCRLNKGSHAGVDRLNKFIKKVTKNGRTKAYVLKCDIRKFFDSIDHLILLKIIEKYVQDEKTIWLIKSIILGFEKSSGKGLPLGNVTSQLFGNIYMHVFDHYVKHNLKIKYYVRYCDDFVLVNTNKRYLEDLIPKMDNFLQKELLLKIHPNKISLRKVSQGIDFLGYVIFPHHKILRTSTKQRILKKWKSGLNEAQQNSYLGVLVHAKSFKIRQSLQIAKKA